MNRILLLNFVLFAIKIKSKLLSVLLIITVASLSVNAQTVTWDGGAGTNNWTDANNWNPNGVPGASNDVRIEIAATVNLVGASPTIERLAIDHASASLTIANGVSLTVDGTNFDGIRVSNGSITNNGIILVQNIGDGGNDNAIDVRSTFNNNGNITVDGTTDDGVVVYGGAIFNNNLNASLTINNAGDFGLYIDTGGTPSTFNNDGTVTVNNAPDDAVRIETGTLNNNATGTIDVNNPADLGISILNDGDLNNAGSIDVSGAVLRYGIELFFDSPQTATLDNLNGGTINITSSNLDGLFVGVSTTLNNDGTITINSSGAADINRESGSTFNNTSNASFAPGTSPGTLSVNGDFDLGSSTYNCEINGITTNTQYDVLAISGAATLTNATLVVDWGGFTPSAGQSFTVMTFASHVGEFATVTIPANGGLAFTTTYNAGNVTISTALPTDVNWTGGTGDWNVGANWEFGAVPTAVQNARFSSGDVATVPTGFAAVAKSVDLSGGSCSLTIAATGSLTINGSSGQGFTVNHDNAIFSNSGILNIGKTTAPSGHGIIFNKGTFTNNSGGLIEIGSATLDGIVTFASAAITLNNSGTIKIGTTGSVRDGYNTTKALTFNNLAGGVLEIDNATSDGIELSNAATIFNNEGIVEIGKTTPPSNHAIRIGSGSLTNSGTIDIGAAGFEGFIIFANGTTSNNSGTIKIGTTGNVRRGLWIRSGHTFNNLLGGVIEIDNTTSNGIDMNHTSAAFTNAGTVKIGNNAAIAVNGIAIFPCLLFNNQSGGLIEINNTTQNGIIIGGAATNFTNAGTLKVGNSSALNGRGILITDNQTFDNQSGGIIEISNLANSNAIEITGGTGLTNSGSITFGKNSQVRTGLSSTVVVANAGTMLFDNIQFAGLAGATTLTNNMGATIETLSGGNLQTGGNTTLVNNGTLTNNGTLINNGTFKGTGNLVHNGSFNSGASSNIAPGASPGKFSVTGNYDLGATTYNCEINGTTAETEYDVLAVSGTAVLLNATLIVDWGGFTPLAGQTYTIMTFGNHVGEFATVTIPTVSGLMFTPNYSATTLTLSAAVLPVELTEFRATLTTENTTSLFWETATEINNEGFQIERSNDGRIWEILDFVNGHGSSQQTQTYTFIDEKPLANLNYYRLKQMDYDGNYEYSKTVSVNVEKGGNIVVYPNPSTGKFNISGIDIQNATVSIYSTLGQLVKEEILTQSVLDISDLVDGLYYLMVKQGAVVYEVKVLKKSEK